MKVVKRDLIGRKFGSLTVLDSYRQIGEKPNRRTYWLCQCECGNQIFVERNSLIRRTVQYCDKCRPCGVRNTRLYHIYHGMKQRCKNPRNNKFDIYGKNGISVCTEWDMSYDAFKNWSENNGYKDGLTIDRIDPSVGYCPENCRWITLSENSRRANMGKVKHTSKLKFMYAISPDNEKIEITNITHFAEEYNLPYPNVSAALHGRISYKKSKWKFYSNLTNVESVTTIETIPAEKSCWE